MPRSTLGKLGFVLTNVVVMVVLHGNSRQFWPKIPLLSLRNESTGEHVRLIFNTLAVSTGFEAALGRFPRARWLPRAISMLLVPAALPALLFFGHRVLGLKGRAAEVYNLALVPVLPVAAVAVEDAVAARFAAPAPADDHADYEHLV
jgi:hypothetical protein